MWLGYCGRWQPDRLPAGLPGKPQTPVDAPWAHGDSHVTFIGDYMGLDASSQEFQPVWTDTRTGIQELFATTVPADLGLCIVEFLNDLDKRRNRARPPVP